MPSTDITLPRDVTARFPQECIVCGAGNPDVTVQVSDTISANWFSWSSKGKLRVDAPACYFCAPSFRWQRRRRAAIVWLSILAGFAFGLWLHFYFHVPRFLGKVLVLGAVAVSQIPWVIWHIAFPPIFDITAHEDRVEYEFLDPAYAAEFAKLNGVAPAE